MSERVKPASSEPIPKEYQKMQWAVVAYQLHENGQWIEGDSAPPDATIIKYANGWIYDFILKRLGYSPWRHVDD
jgi:hypothetical protein